MANNELHIDIAENQVRVPLSVRSRNLLRTVTPDDGNPYYVGAKAYVTQDEDGATITIIDKDGTTTAVVENGTDGQDGATGNGIASIELTSTSGNVDTYTITYDNGDTDGFTVTNGVDGQNGADGVDGYSPTATVEKVGTTSTITITDINGTTTAEVYDGAGGATAFVAEFNVTPYADVKDAYDDGAIIICTADDSGNTKIFQLAYYDDANGIFYFAEPTGDGWDWTGIASDDTWDGGTMQFASTDTATQLRDGLMTALDKQKLDGIASGAEVNVQSDWNQATNTADDYIKNKPTIPSAVSELANDSGYITSPNVVYCTCSTAAATAAKEATIESGSLTSLNKGDQAIVKFTNANSVASPTLKIGSTDAKSIKRYGTTAPSTSSATSWNAGSAVYFVYDGTYWQQIGFLNSTYSEISSANITNGSGSTAGLVTGRRAKAAVEAFAPIQDVTVDGTSVLSGTTAAIDLSGKSDVGHTHTKSEITDFPALAAVATTGNYNSLTDKPAIHNVPSGGSSGQVLSKASGTDYDLAWVNQGGGGGGITDVEVDGTSVVTGGVAEIDLTGKSDVGHTHTKSAITDFPTLATVATSGSYNDLLNKPTIPTVNDATLTIQKNGTNVQTFTANASSNVTANISVPTDTSDLTNGAGYITGYTETDPVFGASAAAGISSSDISNWNGKSDFSGDYDDLTNKPTIPSDTGDLTNNAGFIKSDYVVVEAVTIGSGTINANTAENLTKDVSKSGYTPVGIIGIRKTGQTYGAVSISRFNIDPADKKTAYISIYNNYSSARTYTVEADILYFKN